jgi:HSP20 family protein
MFRVQQEWPPRIDELQREMERFFDRFSHGTRPRVVFSECVWAPHVDVYDTGENAIVLVDLAGVPREQIQIAVERDQLTLSGERRPPHQMEGRTIHALEVPYGAFKRTIYLPFAVDAARADAAYRDGFLQITLPRIEPQEPRRVPIRTPERPNA